MDKIKDCPILKYHYFLGRKWTYPILFHMKENQGYAFSDFIYITNRKISRSLLLSFLNESISLSIIKKKNQRYMLTKLGLELKKEFIEIKDRLLKHHILPHNICSLKCLINRERDCILTKSYIK